ncbi:MAG: hypothetical protein AB9869_28490 [Verrucomicrobiia bacterium]
MSPTERSLKSLRSAGWTAFVVEHWNAFARVKQDLLGIADILAVRDDATMLVQTTTADHVSHRLARIKTVPAAKAWLACPSRRIAIHGWRKAGKPKRSRCREVAVTPKLSKTRTNEPAMLLPTLPAEHGREQGQANGSTDQQ